uniref:Survival motor neuron protein-like n=1 Tax=Acanthochromis polyacanthus TaxID=80966 RepID=A0A3Q1GF09_9TELE
MTELAENGIPDRASESEDFVAAAVKDEDALEEVFDTALEVPQDVKLTEGEVKEERDVGEKLQNGNGQSACPPAAGSSSTEPEWAVGAECRVVWSEDGQVYPAVVVSVDGERRRVRFIGYGNEEDMEVSALKTSDAEPQPLSSQDWKPGSRCRAVFSEDGLVYPAVVLWVKGQRCRIRFDEYNNEEEQDVSGLLNPDELYGPSRAKDPLPFLPLFPPPLPAWMFGGKESGTPSPIDATSSIMMLWYMCGFHTGSYLAQQQFRSTSKD